MPELNHDSLSELTADETQNIAGGDWWDVGWGAVAVAGVAAGAFAAPAFLLIAGAGALFLDR